MVIAVCLVEGAHAYEAMGFIHAMSWCLVLSGLVLRMGKVLHVLRWPSAGHTLMHHVRVCCLRLGGIVS